MPGVAARPVFSGAFDPIAFFQGRTLGQAVVRTPLGRMLHRCEIETLGTSADDYQALHFDERYAFDNDGPDDVMHWAIGRNPGAGRLDARELSVHGRVRSELDGACWRVRFKRKSPPASAGPTLLYDVRFCQVTEAVVMKSVRLSLLGIPVAFMSAFHRRIG